MSPEFLITSLVVVLAPGTGVLYTLAVGLGRGSKPSIAAAFGCTIGIVPHLLAAVLGLAALLHASAVLFQIVKIAGVLYLLYLAWLTLREKGGLLVERETRARSYGDIAIKGTLINILNPKLSLFFFAFLPQFVSPGTATPTMEMIGLGLVFMAMTFAVFVVYGLLASTVRERVIGNARVMAWLRYGFAGCFAALGAKLALADR
ncbi:LysE family translocator [Magnetospira sp. QH-2]|uniref:LysE family translocator n=1 Tax=Magnetospira sp. (strain QH-2) TaxID=1288970 RepID=UPI0003E81466|nr:LysE family translocator [Magnetospira sp. QH-2]CCQ73772.1 Putative lysine exporter protein (LYSE/YGGA) [Magnetospira sp. QH-2]